ncbi:MULTISPECIES: GPW/gp25 family protein [Alteromonadaceae]|uniref:GPW/gp25 family protein n=1 Tax=Alteromonadaceae TaxID=72275 RepID=UPI001C090D1D|nr:MULTISPECIES: GPW/gp25 family protein [Aliiglaciecola]MBU2876694.1 GPW/gp25 family protein [Aliiglaciecola lipolytica]MDO6710286.1 GPW/gp25 family protein [Aliiglaciecola sp. 2_MG-2023]MDO6751434.1 GPW/gp25 family protein [Aliiglaciecola sp. 1_MG-2023]
MTQSSPLKAFLGKGWAFPVQPSQADKTIAYVEGAEKVRQSIWMILQTEPMERIMRPNFGCGLRRYLMQPNNSATWSGIQRDIERALSRWEPRIKLEEVKVNGGEDPSVAMISIRYSHVQDGSRENLVFPFYLE